MAIIWAGWSVLLGNRTLGSAKMTRMDLIYNTRRHVLYHLSILVVLALTYIWNLVGSYIAKFYIILSQWCGCDAADVPRRRNEYNVTQKDVVYYLLLATIYRNKIDVLFTIASFSHSAWPDVLTIEFHTITRGNCCVSVYWSCKWGSSASMGIIGSR